MLLPHRPHWGAPYLCRPPRGRSHPRYSKSRLVATRKERVGNHMEAKGQPHVIEMPSVHNPAGPSLIRGWWEKGPSTRSALGHPRRIMVARERAGHAAWAFWIFLHPWLFALPCLASQPLPGHASTLGDSLPPPLTPRPCLAPRTLRHATPCKRREEGGWVLWGRRRIRGRDVDCGGEEEGDYGGDGLSR